MDGYECMFVPLIVNPVVKYGKEKLEIWRNAEQQFIDAPIDPYFYSYQKLDIPETKVSELEAIALSNYKPKKFYKYEFKTRDALVRARDNIEKEHGHGITFEDHIPFVLRNRIDNVDFYTKFQQTKELVFLFLDIEQYTKPGTMFPDYSDRITAISYCTNDRNIKTIYLRKETETDKKLLEVFIEQYNRISPDIIVV